MIKIEVGKKEKHKIRFDYDQVWGKLLIEVDGKVIIEDRKMMAGYYPFEFEVGVSEKHHIKIDLSNPFGFIINGSTVYIHVDGKTIRQEKIINNRLSLFSIFLFILFVIMFLTQIILWIVHYWRSIKFGI